MLVAVTTFTVAAVLVVLLPGPDTLVVVRNLMAGGRRLGLRASLGAMTGLSIWVVAASLGLSALLTASHDGYLALRVVGAVYLCWMGLTALRAKPHDGPAVPGEAAEPRRGVLGAGFTAGLLTDLLNPKVGVFFVSFMPGFIPHGAPVAGTSLLLGAIFVVLTAAYYGAMLVLSGPI